MKITKTNSLTDAPKSLSDIMNLYGDLPVSNFTLGIDICDLTNIPNPYQGALRVGKFDLSEMRGRIVHDLGKPDYISGKDAPFVSLFITHMGNPPQDFQTFDLPKLKSEFDNVYISRSSVIGRGSIQQL